jgi:2-polyprenyl-3-methyl-5-hydroxy-6-metoxy-1,4-benzoquinol methylase
MKKIDYETIKMYKVHKSLLFEGWDGTKLDLVMKKLQMAISKLMGIQFKPLFGDRIVEYPLLFQHLNPNAKTILDFGCVEDLLPLHFASMGYKVDGLDFREYVFEHPNFKFTQADILTWQPPENFYDMVCSISTVEHVGLTGYGDPEKSDGDKVAISKLWTALKPGGDLILTMPAGKATTRRNMRIYDLDRIKSVVPNPRIVRFFAKPTRYGNWSEVTADEIKNLVYEDYEAPITPGQGVAFIVATK